MIKKSRTSFFLKFCLCFAMSEQPRRARWSLVAQTSQNISTILGKKTFGNFHSSEPLLILVENLMLFGGQNDQNSHFSPGSKVNHAFKAKKVAFRERNCKNAEKSCFFYSWAAKKPARWNPVFEEKFSEPSANPVLLLKFSWNGI